MMTLPLRPLNPPHPLHPLHPDVNFQNADLAVKLHTKFTLPPPRTVPRALGPWEPKGAPKELKGTLKESKGTPKEPKGTPKESFQNMEFI